MKRAFLIGLAVCVFTGCMTVEIGASLETPVSVSGTLEDDYVVVRHFENKTKAWFTLFDLVTMKNPDFSALIEEELIRTPGDAVINLEIVGQTTAIDGLIPIAMTIVGTLLGQALAPDPYSGAVYGTALGTVAGAMLSARTFTVSGDIAKYQ